MTETAPQPYELAISLYYEDQRAEAKRRTASFLDDRVPKFLGYFEKVLERRQHGSGPLLAENTLTYVDLSFFQLIEGLRYAFPRAMASAEGKYPLLLGVHTWVAAQPRVAAYLASERRIAFNESGIFRRYPELDRS